LSCYPWGVARNSITRMRASHHDHALRHRPFCQGAAIGAVCTDVSLGVGFHWSRAGRAATDRL
jgi:hypothetical protein